MTETGELTIAKEVKRRRPTDDSAARYGANLLPVDTTTTKAGTAAWDPCQRLKMCYSNPVTGDHAMASMGTSMQLLPKGFSTAAYTTPPTRRSWSRSGPEGRP